jgi:hypothetical protein
VLAAGAVAGASFFEHPERTSTQAIRIDDAVFM